RAAARVPGADGAPGADPVHPGLPVADAEPDRADLGAVPGVDGRRRGDLLRVQPLALPTGPGRAGRTGRRGGTATGDHEVVVQVRGAALPGGAAPLFSPLSGSQCLAGHSWAARSHGATRPRGSVASGAAGALRTAAGFAASRAISSVTRGRVRSAVAVAGAPEPPSGSSGSGSGCSGSGSGCSGTAVLLGEVSPAAIATARSHSGSPLYSPWPSTPGIHRRADTGPRSGSGNQCSPPSTNAPVGPRAAAGSGPSVPSARKPTPSSIPE